jgi:hypothetical protein
MMTNLPDGPAGIIGNFTGLMLGRNGSLIVIQFIASPEVGDDLSFPTLGRP